MTTITHNRRRKNSPLLPAIIVVLLIIAVFTLIFWRDGVASLIWRIGEPAIKTSIGAGSFMGNVVASFTSRGALEAENNRLRQALATSSIALLDRDVLVRENRELQARVGRATSTREVIFAGVLLHPPGTPYDTLIIDAGKNDGVQVGNLVSPGGTIVIGTIDAAYDTSARVKLFSAPEETHEGFIAGTVPVTVHGQGGGALVAEVPLGEQVQVGSEVMFPGTNQRISAYVSAVETKEGASFTTVYMTLAVNIFSVRFVDVLSETILYEQE